MKLHERLHEVTARIRQRSTEARTAYLARLDAMADARGDFVETLMQFHVDPNAM